MSRLRVLLALVIPPGGALLISLLARSASPGETLSSQSGAVLWLGPLGIISWFLGLRWYRLPGMGLRGRRPLFAGIGFAVLGWIAFLLFRLLFLRSISQGTGLREFVYLLLFEAFAVQLWVYGLLFRAFADWRGPLTAAVGSGILFGAVATALPFSYAVVPDVSGLFYFMLWGVLYGIIRLRTGSLLGTVLIQAIQSFTGWVALIPEPLELQAGRLTTFYVVTGLSYLIIIWRLWPKRESDYRV